MVEQKNPCGPSTFMMLVLGIGGAFLGFWGGVIGAAKIVARKNPPTR